MTRSNRARALRAVVSQVEELTMPIFHALDELADYVRTHVDLTRYPVFADPTAWDEVEPGVARVLGEQPLTTGAGLAVLLGENPTDRPSMAWWVSRSGGIQAKQHVFNPRSDSFYDVSATRWFRAPYDSGKSTLLPPYVDSWGTDDVTMTASAPLRLGEGVAGVVAADLNVRRYIAAVEVMLNDLGPAALLDDEDRVIAANVPQLENGTRLGALTSIQMVADAAIEAFGWRIVRLSE